MMQGAKGREGRAQAGQVLLVEGCSGVTLQGWGQQSTGRAEQPPASSVFAAGRGERGCGICKASSGVRRGLVGTGCYSRPTGCCNPIRACS